MPCCLYHSIRAANASALRRSAFVRAHLPYHQNNHDRPSLPNRTLRAGPAPAAFLVRIRLHLQLPVGHACRNGRTRPRRSSLSGIRFCSGRSSRNRVGTRRRSIFTRPRAGTCGRTWNGNATSSAFLSSYRTRFPQNSLMAARIAHAGRQSPWIGAFVRAVFDAEFGQGQDISDPALLAGLLMEAGADAKTVLKGSRVHRRQDRPARRRFRSGDPRHLRGGPVSSPSTAISIGATTGLKTRSTTHCCSPVSGGCPETGLLRKPEILHRSYRIP